MRRLTEAINNEIKQADLKLNLIVKVVADKKKPPTNSK